MDLGLLFFVSLFTVVFCGFLGAILLEESGRAPLGVLLGLLLGPIGVVIAAILRRRPKAESWERS